MTLLLRFASYPSAFWTLVGNNPLTPTDKYFKNPSGLYFICRGIARDVPITIDKLEVHLDFYIYDILDFGDRMTTQHLD